MAAWLQDDARRLSDGLHAWVSSALDVLGSAAVPEA